MPYDDGFTGDRDVTDDDDNRGRNTPVAQSTGAPRPRPRGGPRIAPNQGGNTYQSASQQIQDAYRLYLDRDASPQEIADQLGGGRYFAPENVRHAISNIRGSEEARNYRMSETAVKEPPEPPTTTTPTTSTGVPPRIGPAPHGWDQEKWADPNHHTTKYDVAAFLYGVTEPSEVKRIVESAPFQERFPGATFDGKDKIDFGDNLEDGVPVGIIDVLMQADRGGDTSGGLWWGDTENDPAPDLTGRNQLDTGDNLTQVIPDEDNPLSAPNLDAPPNTLMGPVGGGGMMGPVGGGGGTMGQMITPYNPLATYSPTPYTPPAPFQPPAYQGATPFGQDPYAAATPFTGPTAEDMAADPSYQFRLQQGQEALERSGAARGVTNTGGTLKDILDYGQQAASQEYGNVYGRQRDVYDMNERNRFNAYEANWGNAMDAYRENERNRAGAFDTNVMNARDAYEMNERNRYQGYTTNELARWEQNQEAEARRSDAYTTNLGAYQDQQQYGLKQQGQGFDQSFRNWQEQFNQQRLNQTTAFNQRYLLGTT